jgi:hypothetical protein
MPQVVHLVGVVASIEQTRWRNLDSAAFGIDD